MLLLAIPFAVKVVMFFILAFFIGFIAGLVVAAMVVRNYTNDEIEKHYAKTSFYTRQRN